MNDVPASFKKLSSMSSFRMQNDPDSQATAGLVFVIPIKFEFSSELPSEFILTGLKVKHATFKSILFEISKDRRIFYVFYVYHYANCESPHINIGG